MPNTEEQGGEAFLYSPFFSRHSPGISVNTRSLSAPHAVQGALDGACSSNMYILGLERPEPYLYLVRYAAIRSVATADADAHDDDALSHTNLVVTLSRPNDRAVLDRRIIAFSSLLVTLDGN